MTPTTMRTFRSIRWRGGDRPPAGGRSRARARRRRRRPRGLHAPDLVRRRPRAGPARASRPDPRADDARHRLRPAHRHGLRAQARLLLGREPGRRLAPPPARGGRARLAGAARARGALARGHGHGVRGRRLPPPLRGPARLRRERACGADEGRLDHLPVHGREPRRRARHPPRRRDRPRPARGRGRERAAVGDRGRPEGGRARLRPVPRDRGGDRPRARAAAGRRCPPHLGGDGRGARAGRRPPVLRAGLLRPGQRLLRRVGPDQPRSRPVPRVDAGQRPGGRRERRRRAGLHGRRDDGRRRRTAARRRDRLLRRDRAPEPGGEPRAGDARARLRPRVRERARSERSRRACRCRSATASWARPPTRSSRSPRSSRTGSRGDVSTSAFSAPPRSTASGT